MTTIPDVRDIERLENTSFASAFAGEAAPDEHATVSATPDGLAESWIDCSPIWPTQGGACQNSMIDDCPSVWDCDPHPLHWSPLAPLTTSDLPIVGEQNGLLDAIRRG